MSDNVPSVVMLDVDDDVFVVVGARSVCPVEVALRDDPLLDDEQRQILVSVYRSLTEAEGAPAVDRHRHDGSSPVSDTFCPVGRVEDLAYSTD